MPDYTCRGQSLFIDIKNMLDDLQNRFTTDLLILLILKAIFTQRYMWQDYKQAYDTIKIM